MFAPLPQLPSNAQPQSGNKERGVLLPVAPPPPDVKITTFAEKLAEPMNAYAKSTGRTFSADLARYAELSDDAIVPVKEVFRKTLGVPDSCTIKLTSDKRPAARTSMGLFTASSPPKRRTPSAFNSMRSPVRCGSSMEEHRNRNFC